MDKNDWKKNLELLEKLLISKTEDQKKIEQDMEEISYTIECYKKKIESLPDVPEAPKVEKAPLGLG
jgi:hypothetical protein